MITSFCGLAKLDGDGEDDESNVVFTSSTLIQLQLGEKKRKMILKALKTVHGNYCTTALHHRCCK